MVFGNAPLPASLERKRTSATLPTACESSNSSSLDGEHGFVDPSLPPPPVAHVMVPSALQLHQPPTTLWPPPSTSASCAHHLRRGLAHCYLVTALCELIGAAVLLPLVAAKVRPWWIEHDIAVLLLIAAVATLWDAVPTLLLCASQTVRRRKQPLPDEPFLVHVVFIDASSLLVDAKGVQSTLESLVSSASSIVVLLLTDDNDATTVDDQVDDSFRAVLRIGHRREAIPAIEQYIQQQEACMDPYHVILTMLPTGACCVPPSYWETLSATYHSLPDGQQFLYHTPALDSCGVKRRHDNAVVALTLGFGQTLQAVRDNPWGHCLSLHAHAVTGCSLAVTLPIAVVVQHVALCWTAAVQYERERNYTSVVDVLQWYSYVPLNLWWKLLRRVMLPHSLPPTFLLPCLCLLLSRATLAALAAYCFAYSCVKTLVCSQWMRQQVKGRSTMFVRKSVLQLRDLCGYETILTFLAAGWVLLQEVSARLPPNEEKLRPVKKVM